LVGVGKDALFYHLWVKSIPILERNIFKENVCTFSIAFFPLIEIGHGIVSKSVQKDATISTTK
jgi:hypothetical protein